MLNIKMYIRRAIAIACVGAWVIVSDSAIAVPDGISGFSGASGATCTACHGPGSITPMVTLSADSGSVTVSPGSVTSYTFTMTGGPAVDAGLDVAVSSGTLIATNALTNVLNGEVVQTQPNPVSGGTISWSFDWQAPMASGTYTLYAAALSANGDDGLGGDGVSTTTLDVTVTGISNQLPVAVISAPTTGIEGAAITFDGSGSLDPDGTIVSYDWNFGDGGNAIGDITTHTFVAGTYDVTLTVTDEAGDTDIASITIQISASNVPPTAAISGPTNGSEGVAVTFDGAGSSDPDGNVVDYVWDFGDSTAGSGVSVSHTFAAGIYTVTLLVTDDFGATDSAALVIDIAAATEPQPPIADAGGPYSGTVGAVIQYDGSGSTDQDGSIQSYQWDFGDNSSGTGVGPVHVYTAPGTYNVVLTVTDNDGLSGQSQTTADINAVLPPPDPTPIPGETLYNTYCASCHGAGGLEEDVIGESADDIIEAIEEEPTMVFLANVLSEMDINAIAEFLNQESDLAGETLYNTYCASCHGAGGAGGLEEDVIGESADDIIEAIEEEPTMVSLANVLSEMDIKAIAEFLNEESNRHRTRDRDRDSDEREHDDD